MDILVSIIIQIFMSLRSINKLFFLLIALFGTLSIKGGTKKDAKNIKNTSPNIAIIFIDDMGFADPSCFGNPLLKTPNIDALADQGAKFTNFYVMSPICSPSRVALNTGQYPMRYKIHSHISDSQDNERRSMNNYLDTKAPILARTLNENGYCTGHFGKWHMGGGRDNGDVPFPTDYGFDESLVAFEGIGNRVLFPNDNLSVQNAKLGKGKIIWAEKCISTSIYVDSVLAFVSRCGDKPFYVNLCPNDVHDPHLPYPSKIEKWKTITDNPFEQRFFAVLEELDIQIGRFIDGLRKAGKLDNTIIVLSSDNGPCDWPFYYKRERYPDHYQGKLYPPGFTGKFFGRKFSLYEGGIRMPFIISWQGHIPRAYTDSTTIMTTMDLFPSLCSILNITYPGNLDGIDKSKALLGTPINDVPPVMWEYASNPGGSLFPGGKDHKSPNLAIRDGDWKLLINVNGSDPELFNLKNDPSERNNLVKSNKRIAERLSEKVINWRKSLPVGLAIN